MKMREVAEKADCGDTSSRMRRGAHLHRALVESAHFTLCGFDNELALCVSANTLLPISHLHAPIITCRDIPLAVDMV